MKNLSKFLVYAWLFGAVLNLAAFIFDGYDVDKFFIAALECYMAYYNYQDYKRGE